MATYAGVDLGATTVAAVVGDATGAVRGRAERGTPAGPDGRTVAAAVVGTLREACDDAGVAPADLAGTGVASAGPLDVAAGAAVDTPNLPVDRVPLVDPVAEAVGSDRVVLRNDATAGVVGERFHDPDPPANLVYLTVSTGVGAGVCVDGRVLGGRDGNAGEVGHFVVDPLGRLECGCGRRGHWEAYCSGRGMPAYARFLAGPGTATDLPLADPALDAADVLDRAGADPFADRVLDRVARFNAVGVAGVVHAYAPEAVVVGGSVARNNWDRVVDPLRDRLPDHVMTAVPSLRRERFGAWTGARGALAVAVGEFGGG